VDAEADDPDRHHRQQAGARRPSRAQAPPSCGRGRHHEWQQQARRQLDANPGRQRRDPAARARCAARGQHERQRGHQHHQRVVVRAAHRHHQQHRVQSHERGRPARVLSQPTCRPCDQRDGGETRHHGERLERPQPGGHRERCGGIAGEREQRAVGRVLKGPAHVPVHGVAGCFGGEVGVRVEAVQRAHARERQVAEHVLGDQRRPERQQHVRKHDRPDQRSGGQRARREQDQHVAGAHDQHQRLKARTAQAAAQMTQRPRQPHRPAAFARRHVLRGLRGRIAAQQRHRDEHAEQAHQARYAQRARAPCLGLHHAGGGRPARWRAHVGGWDGGAHESIVTSVSGASVGAPGTLYSQLRPPGASVRWALA
jgi:hypothetical protein